MINPVVRVVKKVGKANYKDEEIKHLIHEVKSLLEKNVSYVTESITGDSENTPMEMMPFNPRLRDPYNGGQRWLSQLQQNLGETSPDPWIPDQTHDFFGINLTGIWAPSLNPLDQSYIRQYGPYLNYIIGTAGIPNIFAEGLFNPLTGAISLVGKDIFDNPFIAHLQLSCEWSINGDMTVPDVYGDSVKTYTEIYRMA
ncbi:MAG: hypothetical protein JXR70_02200 [Spirochaetales bacterium]|nr:hypothetical protein [Spirochaetales bacterium]